MFNFFKKTSPEAKSPVQDLTKLVNISLENQKGLVTFFEEYSKKIVESLEHIKKLSTEHQGWGKEFHRLLLNEYAQVEQGRVYGFIFAKTIVHLDTSGDKTVRRLALVSADTFEKARTVAEMSLAKEGEDIKQWQIEGYQHITIPKTSEDLSSKIDEKLYDSSKPIGVFLNDLMFCKEKYATTPTEKKTLSTIINRIEKTHSANINK